MLSQSGDKSSNGSIVIGTLRGIDIARYFHLNLGMANTPLSLIIGKRYRRCLAKANTAS
jgi:hypothetical protein